MNSYLAARAISGQPSVEFVRTSCNSTTYPQLCYSSLSSYASAIQSSPKLLTQTAISVSLATARNASTMMSKLSKSRGMKPREVGAMIDCVEEISECVEQLQKSVEKMSHVGGFKFVVQMSDIQTWVSAALTDEDTCMEGFTGNAMNGTVKSKVRSQLVGYTNSDWAGDFDERKRTSGYVFFMGNMAFSWSSKKQLIVTLSTCEAEYVAASSGVCHAIWLRNMLKELQIMQEEPTKIYLDNKSAIAIANNPILYERSKHIDTRFHFIREHVKDKEIELIHVKSQDNISDIFTKPLKHESFLLLWKQLVIIKFKGGC
ncbi:hypothetical protein HHK36_027954 [Tetracentron sinense]|uniref:Pectinesterase inhibitor domain-containing protein n=1 Tax=Tetracentron sinense TaxID=13715 RepID=A0A834YE09_TETSI|nr:hypothetical protein HHK36_027954 [Tetracentron sinense]